MTTNPKYLIARFQKIGNVQKKTTTDMGMIVETAGVIEMVTYIVPGSTEVWCL